MKTNFDHLVIAAASLKQGAQWFTEKFGVEIPYGGSHPSMATHNHLAQLSDETFIEIIAIDPEAEPPQRPRWFGLDDPLLRGQLQESPRLIGWAVNSQRIESLLAGTEFDFGRITQLSRGELNWLFSVPDDGRLLCGGFVPYVLQWSSDNHPANNMADLGLTLQSFRIFHPYTRWLESILSSIDASAFVQLSKLPANHTPYMIAEIKTANGIIELSSHAT